jgi:hypothetical protein
MIYSDPLMSRRLAQRVCGAKLTGGRTTVN